MNDTYRRRFKSELEEERRSVKMTIKRNEETIDRLTNEPQPFQVDEVLAKTKASLAALQAEEELLSLKIADAEAGFYDDQLREQRQRTQDDVRSKAQNTIQKKAASAKSQLVMKASQQAPRKPWQRFPRDPSFVSDREMAYQYDRFVRSCNKLPPKLAEKLEHLPNNHGIIFNQISFYGKRAPRRPLDTLVLQDKQGDKFLVHYWTPTEHTVYVKQGYGRNAKEVLVSHETRRRIPTGFSPPK